MPLPRLPRGFRQKFRVRHRGGGVTRHRDRRACQRFGLLFSSLDLRPDGPVAGDSGLRRRPGVVASAAPTAVHGAAHYYQGPPRDGRRAARRPRGREEATDQCSHSNAPEDSGDSQVRWQGHHDHAVASLSFSLSLSRDTCHVVHGLVSLQSSHLSAPASVAVESSGDQPHHPQAQYGHAGGAAVPHESGPVADDLPDQIRNRDGDISDAPPSGKTKKFSEHTWAWTFIRIP